MGAADAQKMNYLNRFKQFLSDKSKLYQCLSSLKNTAVAHFFKQDRKRSLNSYDWEEIKSDAIQKQKFAEIYESGNLKTVFTPAYRLSALNFEDARISEGFQMSLKALKILAENSEQADIQFVVLLIPTKELVFKGVVDLTKMSENYKNQTAQEESLWLKTKSFLKDNQIDFVDALPVLRALVLEGRQPYPMTSSGHPNEIGHEMIAEEMVNYLNEIQGKL